MNGGPWERLGIAATTDTRAIRRAYSDQLKAIDVEVDPDAFIALREAYDWANAEAREMAWQAQDEAATADLAPTLADDGHGVAEEYAPLTDEEPPPADEALAPAESAIDENADERREADARRLTELVYGDMPRAEIFDEVAAITRRLLDDPDMERIAHSAAIEHWMAETILRGIPRSNAMLAPAINYFGWQRLADEWHCPPMVRQVMARHRDCLFVDGLDGRSDGLGNAYRILSEPPGSYRLAVDQIEGVSDLLGTIRADHPTAEYALNDGAVTEWEVFIERRRNAWPQKLKARLGFFNGPSRWTGGLRGSLWLTFILLMIFGRVAAFIGADHASPPTQQPAADVAAVQGPALADPERDIDTAVKMFSASRSLADVERNPALKQELFGLWRDDQAANKDQWAFIRGAEDHLNRRFSRALPNAPPDLIVEFQRVRHDQAEHFERLGMAQLCADLLEGKSRPPLGRGTLRDREVAIVQRVIFEARELAPGRDGPTRFAIPGEIVVAARDRSGLSDARFSKALLGEGTPDSRCRTRIALLEVLLDRPQGDALSLLRKV